MRPIPFILTPILRIEMPRIIRQEMEKKYCFHNSRKVIFQLLRVLLLIKGIELQRVNQIASEIRDLREPDAYKGKGIQYYGEKLNLKKGKREGK